MSERSFTNSSKLSMQEVSIFSGLNLLACLGSMVPVLFINNQLGSVELIQQLKGQHQSMQMIDNERMSTVGSNESQEGLESAAVKGENIGGVKGAINLNSLEKLSFHLVTLIRFCCCIFIGIILANRFSSQNISQLSNGIVASNDILLDKGLRGIFPPLDGKQDQIYGKWRQTFTTSLKNSTSAYNNYFLNFKTNGDVQLTHLKCKGDLRLEWQTFYYNIYLNVKQRSADESDMQIPNEREDVQCIVENGTFVNILTNSSIWSIHSNNLYIISEVSMNGTMENYMLIFQKVGP